MAVCSSSLLQNRGLRTLVVATSLGSVAFFPLASHDLPFGEPPTAADYLLVALYCTHMHTRTKHKHSYTCMYTHKKTWNKFMNLHALIQSTHMYQPDVHTNMHSSTQLVCVCTCVYVCLMYLLMCVCAREYFCFYVWCAVMGLCVCVSVSIPSLVWEHAG